VAMENGVALRPETWVDEHGDCLFRYALVRVHDPDAASDLVQETFVEALRARETFSGRSSVRTWLVAILKHKIVDRLRKRGRELRVQADDASGDAIERSFDQHGHWQTPPLDWGSDPLQEYERREFWEVIGQCLSQIPSHLADAFLDRELEGTSREVICRDRNITPENLAVRLYRARLLLRRCLEIRWFQAQGKIPERPAAATWFSRRRHVPEGR
jgi:RNA polymerase sigma-70 factor (TIGR02943 family)